MLKRNHEELNPQSVQTLRPPGGVFLYTQMKWPISEASFKDIILPHLIQRESQTWQEIIEQSGGRNTGTNSHEIPISDICKSAQEELEVRKLDDIDVLFSLRIDSQKRLWGVRYGRILKIMWYDPKHEICPSYKKHT